MVSLSKEIQDKILEEATAKSRSISINEPWSACINYTRNKFYNEVVKNEGFAGVEELVPATVFERVFEDLEQSHPLLQNYFC